MSFVMFKYYIENWRSTSFYKHYTVNGIIYKLQCLKRRKIDLNLKGRQVFANWLVNKTIPLLHKIDSWAGIQRPYK